MPYRSRQWSSTFWGKRKQLVQFTVVPANGPALQDRDGLIVCGPRSPFLVEVS